jgi:hypothetical protein
VLILLKLVVDEWDGRTENPAQDVGSDAFVE